MISTAILIGYGIICTFLSLGHTFEEVNSIFDYKTKGFQFGGLVRGLDDVIMYLRLKVAKRKNGILGFV